MTHVLVSSSPTIEIEELVERVNYIGNGRTNDAIASDVYKTEIYMMMLSSLTFFFWTWFSFNW